MPFSADSDDPVIAAVSRARAALSTGQAAIRMTYETRRSSSSMLRARAHLVDKALDGLWQAFAMPRDTALIAVGGYGRGELFPCSDVDLMVLLSETASASLREKLSALIGALWDIGLDIGYSVRTVDEALEAAADDIPYRPISSKHGCWPAAPRCTNILSDAFTNN